MIYCHLKGGLGNMLFQIAMIKSLSIDLDTTFSIPNLIDNLHLINNDNLHNPKIKHSFEYLENMPFLQDINTDPPNKNINIIKYPFNYDQLELPKNEDFLIDGFFQSEKYFLHNKKEILNWFNFSDRIKKIVFEKYGNFLKLKPTSLHVRRGDYLKFPKIHYVQSIEYYRNAVDVLKPEHLLIFSDDIEWCKNNLNFKNCSFIENEKDYIELYLMSLCVNNIISNSSFSWWGAWMNNNNDKKIIGPKIWFHPNFKTPSYDIIPNNWIKI
jgi:hypothetical protein